MSIEIVSKEKMNKYLFNVATVKKYGNSYKVQWQRSVINKGVSVGGRTRNVNDEKLSCNIRRAKNKIKEYALCNDWQFFVTLTLNKDKIDRYDIKNYIKKLSWYIINTNRNREDKIQYLLIPEMHRDGAWHFHGFLKGLREDEIIREKRHRVTMNGKRKRLVCHWKAYNERFGFDDLEEIESLDKVSSYVTKYITKDMSMSISDKNAKLYYCSRGLNKSEKVATGTVSAKYNPSFTKYSYEFSEPIYSEVWLGEVTEQEALSFINNNTIVDRWQYTDAESPF